MSEILSNKVDNIHSHADFLSFLKTLHRDFETHPNGWENDTLERYLGAITAWVEDMEGYYLNCNEPVPKNVSWNIMAQILLAAKYYE